MRVTWKFYVSQCNEAFAILKIQKKMIDEGCKGRQNYGAGFFKSRN